MFYTTQVLIASLVIMAIVLAMFGYYITYLQKPSVPVEDPVEVTGYLNLSCNKITIHNGTLSYDVVTGINTLLTIGVKNNLGNDVVIDKISPLSSNVSKLAQLGNKLNLRPYEYKSAQIPVNWLNLQLVSNAYPGDVFTIKSGVLQRVKHGLIGLYLNSIPEDEPRSFVCPLGGNHLYNLSIDGNKISTKIKLPGCAPILLKNGSFENVLVLGKLNIDEYYYKDWDIPFFLYLHNDKDYTTEKYGLYFRGGPNDNHGFGFISLYNGQEDNLNEYKPPHGNPFVFGYYYSYITGREEIYADDYTAPILKHDVIAHSLTSIYIGIARAKPARPSVPSIKLYAYYNGDRNYHYIEIDYSEQTYKIVKNGKVIDSGSFTIHKSGDNVRPDLVNHGIAVVENPTPTADTVINVIADRGGGGRGLTTYRLYLPALPNAKIDMIIIWEDLVGYYPPGSSSIDGNGDEWIRVTYFKNGTWRIVGYIARGGFKHVFVLGNETVFVKPHGVGWSNKCGEYFCEYHGHGLPRLVYMPWKEHPITSLVQLAVFRDRTLTIKGLYPGDRIVITTPRKIVSIEANNTVVSIDLLNIFGPEELFEAITRGGLLLAIQPSLQHILTLIPSNILVHVKGKNLNTWIEVPVLLTPTCTLSAEISSANGEVKIVRYGEVYKVYISTGGEESWLLFGVFPKVYIMDIYNYNVTIKYSDGTEMAFNEYDQLNINGNRYIMMPGLGMVLISDKIVYMLGGGILIKDNKDFDTIYIRASTLRIEGYFGK